LSSTTKGFSPVELRGAALHVSHTAFCFVDWRVFRKVRDYPWRLTRGDTRANLDQLVRGSYSGDDLTSQQLRDLHVVGYNTQRLLDTIDLIAQAPWSTGGLEQGHGGDGANSSFALGHVGEKRRLPIHLEPDPMFVSGVC
jgi:hypothetical protein